jgi:hypothetical protein
VDVIVGGWARCKAARDFYSPMTNQNSSDATRIRLDLISG